MIRLDISQALFFYLMSNVVFVLILWVYHGYKRKEKFYVKNTDYVWRCKICANIYIDSKAIDISICPQCGSYNSKNEPKIGEKLVLNHK